MSVKYYLVILHSKRRKSLSKEFQFLLSYNHINFIAKDLWRNFQFGNAVMFPLFITERIGYMAAKKYYSILTLFLIIVLFANVMNVQSVRADGETPTEPPAATEVVTEPPIV